jgi:hypothetical protein
MPFEPDKRVLFIHVPKTAGIFISKNLGVYFSRYYERYRPSLHDSQKLFSHVNEATKERGSRRWSSLPRKFWGLAKLAERNTTSPNGSREYLVGSAKIHISLQNLTVSELLRFGYVSRDQLLSAKKIVSVRHPEDRFRSLVSYWNILELGFSLDWVIQNCMARPNPLIPVEVLATFSPMSFYIHCPLVEFRQWRVIRFEHLLNDLQEILVDIGSEVSLPGPQRINPSESGKVLLESRHIDFIREYYSSDYELFEYN